MSDSTFTQTGESLGSSTGTTESPLLQEEMDDIFKQLSDRHRRLVLYLLKEEAIETIHDIRPYGECNEQRTLQLVHTHLPKLAESGHIEWDQETGTISKGPRFEEIEAFLELFEIVLKT